MKCVILESPYAGDIDRNVAYARRAVRDCLKRDEAPIASHLLFTQPGILSDDDPGERLVGMAAGWAWMQHADLLVVYQDYGISNGMQKGMDQAKNWSLPVEMREIGK